MNISKGWKVSVDPGPHSLSPDETLEVRICSDRNLRISRFLDVSPHHPAPEQEEKRPSGRDHFFPAVDVDLAEGWEGIGYFESFADDDVLYVNGQSNTESIPVASEVPFSTDLLQHWENSVYVHAPRFQMSGFTLRKSITSLDRFEFTALTPNWSGECSVFAISRDGERQIDRCRIESDSDTDAGPDPDRSLSPDDLSVDVLLESLDGFLAYTLRSVDETPNSAVRGGFYLFYDMHASTYRVPNWMWTWGPTIKLLLDSDSRRNDLPVSGGQDLVGVAERAARVSLNFLERNPDHPAYGLTTVRWNTRVDTERGFQQYLSPADTNFLVGWGWIPLYEKTGNQEFLEASKLVAEAESRLVAEYGIPPMDYIEDDKAWKDYTLDEAGFTPEGLAEIYRVTGDESVKQTAVDLTDHMFRILEGPHGLFYRRYHQDTKTAPAEESITRGQGWAMEGLLAMDRMIPGSVYLEKAVRLAEHLVNAQQPDGSWFTRMEGTLEMDGISEKGTALWSLLFYNLYARTGDEKHLNVARRALAWCIRNQEGGEDVHAFGGVAGLSPMSGVVFRRWFPMACLYTSAFAGLAIIEELKIQNAWEI